MLKRVLSMLAILTASAVVNASPAKGTYIAVTELKRDYDMYIENIELDPKTVTSVYISAKGGYVRSELTDDAGRVVGSCSCELNSPEHSCSMKLMPSKRARYTLKVSNFRHDEDSIVTVIVQ